MTAAEGCRARGPPCSALDPLLVQDVDLIVLTPGGKRFNQRMAENFAQRSHLVFACGRYEGIDDRVRQY